MVRRWLSREAAALTVATGIDDPTGAVEKLAADLIDFAELSGPPFDPEILASFQGVREVRVRSMTSAARLVPDANGLVIEVNQDHCVTKRRFSINHESSHTLLPTYAGQLVDDVDTETFKGGTEEELLCDVGAAALLLDKRWLRALAKDGGPSIQTVAWLSSLFQASLHATVRQITQLGLWSCAYVFWEEGLRKAERPVQGQSLLCGMDGFGMPVPKLRVANRYATAAFESTGLYIPQNKSVPASSLISICCDDEPYTVGFEEIDFGSSSGPVKIYCENWYVPYRVGREHRRRVLSVLHPVGQRGAISPPPQAYTLELC